MTIAPLVVSRRTRYVCPSTCSGRPEALEGCGAVRTATPQSRTIRARMPAYYPRFGLSATALALAVHGLVRLMDLLPPPFVLGRGGLVVFTRFIRHFALEAQEVLQPIGVEPAGCDRLLYGAAGFFAVGTVRK